MKMNNNNTMTATDKFLNEFWTAIDISDNINRIEDYVRSAPGGLAAAFIGLFLLSVVGACAYLAYVFDFKSTADGMAALTTFVIPELPESKVEISQWLGLILTIVPTVLEIFAAGLARFQVRIVQIFVVGFTLFDLVTDIPKAMAWTNTLQDQFNQLGIFSGIGHATFFLFWLFLSTIGFELGLIIFAWASFLLFAKSLGHERAERIAGAFRHNKQSKGTSSQPINVQEIINAKARE